MNNYMALPLKCVILLLKIKQRHVHVRKVYLDLYSALLIEYVSRRRGISLLQ